MIRLAKSSDIPLLVKAFKLANWEKSVEIFEQYLQEQIANTRKMWVAFFDEQIAGYITLKFNSEYKNFAKSNIPEISDLNILPQYRNKGLGTSLLNQAETEAKKHSKIIGLGVGLYKDYGAAQKLYIKRGYMPDGNGITYNYQSITPGNKVSLDDDLILWLVKTCDNMFANS